eukprot:SAG22_NODE_11198_length_496_cov_0.806045_1_plen_81_part_01
MTTTTTGTTTIGTGHYLRTNGNFAAAVDQYGRVAHTVADRFAPYRPKDDHGLVKMFSRLCELITEAMQTSLSARQRGAGEL